MRVWRRSLNLALAAALTGSALQASAPRSLAQVPAQAVQAPAELEAKLAAIEKAVEEGRQKLGIPGLSLVIVKDDKIIYMKGLGHRDFERKVPVTPDTLFAIGSSTKAFTSMLVAMGADEGKISLDDSPKKFLPYFKLQDPESDAKITVRDSVARLGFQPHRPRVDNRRAQPRGGHTRRRAGEADGEASGEVAVPERHVLGRGRVRAKARVRLGRS